MRATTVAILAVIALGVLLTSTASAEPPRNWNPDQTPSPNWNARDYRSQLLRQYVEEAVLYEEIKQESAKQTVVEIGAFLVGCRLSPLSKELKEIKEVAQEVHKRVDDLSLSQKVALAESDRRYVTWLNNWFQQYNPYYKYSYDHSNRWLRNPQSPFHKFYRHLDAQLNPFRCCPGRSAHVARAVLSPDEPRLACPPGTPTPGGGGSGTTPPTTGGGTTPPTTPPTSGGGGSGGGGSQTVDLEVNLVFQTASTTDEDGSVRSLGAGHGYVTLTGPDGTHTIGCTGNPCGDDEHFYYPAGTTVTLEATAYPDSSFSSWITQGSSGCGSGASCTFTVSKNMVVNANFVPKTFVLTVKNEAPQDGAVTNGGPSEMGINCGIAGPGTPATECQAVERAYTQFYLNVDSARPASDGKDYEIASLDCDQGTSDVYSNNTAGSCTYGNSDGDQTITVSWSEETTGVA